MNDKELIDSGFKIYTSLLNEEEIINLKNYINETPDDKEYFEPFYKKTSPVRQYLDINNLNNILNNPNFVEKSEKMLNNLLNRDDMKLTYSTILFKDKWYGSEEHWHQDGYYNDIIFENSSMNCYRFFIALDDHFIENSCLKMIPKSEKLGILDHHSIINICGIEKGRISYEDLEKESSNGIVNCEMKKGDGIIFDNIVIHGSCSNQSELPRKALQLQFVSNKLIKRKDNMINKKYIDRNLFALNYYKTKTKTYEEKIEKLEKQIIKLDDQLKLK